jgi:hypothetical protein
MWASEMVRRFMDRGGNSAAWVRGPAALGEEGHSRWRSRRGEVGAVGVKAARMEHREVDGWPRVAPGALTEDESRRAARLLWGVMGTEAPASGSCPVYERFPAYLEQGESERRRPVLDEMLGARERSAGPYVILRHDCDDALDLERWEEWESRLGLVSVTLLRAPVRPGRRAADGSTPHYIMPPPNYDVAEERIGRFIERGVARGCEFGLHYSSPQPAVLEAEVERLRAATGLAPPFPASAHWLQSSGASMRALDRLGVSHDFSFMDFASYASREIPPGAPAHPGFATGTTYPHVMWDCGTGRWLRLIAIPGALEEEFVAGRCPTRPSGADIASYLDVFARQRGLLVLNWHTDAWALVTHLENVVNELRERGFAFVTTSQLRPAGVLKADQAEIADPRVVPAARGPSSG